MTSRETAIKIIKRLRKADYQALLAGGCVRDMLLKRQAKDYDVATDAKPDEVVKLFGRTLKVGAKFGVVMVIINGVQTEVATFRTESGYTDGRHPGRVVFSSPQKDALQLNRRRGRPFAARPEISQKLAPSGLRWSLR